jgi:hypothetical protein
MARLRDSLGPHSRPDGGFAVAWKSGALPQAGIGAGLWPSTGRNKIGGNKLAEKFRRLRR